MLHEAAKRYFDSLGLEKLPSIKELKQEYAALNAENKKLYPDQKAARKERTTAGRKPVMTGITHSGVYGSEHRRPRIFFVQQTIDSEQMNANWEAGREKFTAVSQQQTPKAAYDDSPGKRFPGESNETGL
ncbi:MAG: hypothetical protein LIO95_00140 [Clostridiales bacterium]|nr:hypothetical protein [Clostridiales bacterium]